MRYLQTGSSRWLAGISALVAVLIIVSVVVSLVAKSGSDKLLPADTAEGAVQRYIVALVDNDVDASYAYVGDELRADCSLQHFIQSTDYQRSRDFSARIVHSHDADGVRLVSVEITEFSYSPPFDQGNYSYQAQFTLRLADGQWKFSEPPWPMSWCPSERDLLPTPTAKSLPAPADGGTAK